MKTKHDEGIDIPDIEDELKSAYVRALQAIVYPFSAIQVETPAAFIELSDGRRAQVRLTIDTDINRQISMG